MRDDKTRLFFVVDSKEKNSEIFETYEDACDYMNQIKYEDHPSICVAKVKNAYKQEDDRWNYEDLADTFEQVAYI